jgi:hypothetical protein
MGKWLSGLMAGFLAMAQPAMAQMVVILGPEAEFLGGVAVDGQLCNSYDSDCIWNSYGPYGSSYGQFSIFNNHGSYGSNYGQSSVCNLNISYDRTPYLVEIVNGQLYFYDLIGPSSETLLGLNLYNLACD